MAHDMVLSGYYGFDNLGDELIGAVLLRALASHATKDTPLTLTLLRASNPIALTHHPMYHALYRLPHVTVKEANRWHLTQVIGTLLRCRTFLSGGGGLLQDATGSGSIVYYGGLCLLAKLLGKQVWMVFQGLGPVQTPWLRWFTGAILRSCDKILFRDPESMKLASTLAGCKLPMHLVPDSVWGAKALGLLPQWEKVCSTSNTVLDATKDPSYRLGVSLREWHTLDDTTLRTLARSILSTAQAQKVSHLHVVGLSFQACQDMPMLQALEAHLQTYQPTLAPAMALTYTYAQDTLLKELPTLHALVAMRFHALVLGLVCKLPMGILPYAPKLSSLAKRLALESHVWQPNAISPITSTLWQALPISTQHRIDTLATEATRAFEHLAS
ncbi:MAG: polysaccharide pyruvyl transferase family protein [Vampirovibrionales bacterium]